MSNVRLHRMLLSLTLKILEQPHSAAEYLPWVKSLAAAVRAETDGLRQIRLRIGLTKKLMEEAFPIGIFASRFFESSDEVLIALKTGSQSYDATVNDGRANPSKVKYLEVTVATEGAVDYHRRRLLHETGRVSGFGKITKSGTEKTGLRLKDEPEAVSQATVLTLERRLISDAIDRKSGKAYPEQTALVIAFDDRMAHDRHDNQANIAAVLQEKSGATQGFQTVAVVGVFEGLFIARSRSAA
jgi:hypothetical protein